jgi:mono/diheme cytochrome c family protein
LPPKRTPEIRRISGRAGVGPREFVLASVPLALLAFAGLVSGALISPAAGSPSASPVVRAQITRGAPGAAKADSGRGAKLFQRDCAHCHGVTGDGNSPVRATLHPRPLDLTQFEVADSFVLQVLHNGVPGSDMPAWHASAEKDLRLEAAYTTHLAHPDTLSEHDQYAPPDALAEAGKRVYEAHCAACHGMGGNGDGPDARKHRPRPPSFAGMRPSFAGARQVIENGVAGTAMPSWPLLTPPEIQAVTYYIRSFYNDGGAKRSTTATTGVQP